MCAVRLGNKVSLQHARLAIVVLSQVIVLLHNQNPFSPLCVWSEAGHQSHPILRSFCIELLVGAALLLGTALGTVKAVVEHVSLENMYYGRTKIDPLIFVIIYRYPEL